MIGTRWTVEQVMAAAPDSAAQVAGRRLARPGPWQSVGAADGVLWGECQGSGRTPYRVTVDTGGRRYQCSCPSRKFPCKHALGLLFLWADGAIGESGEIAAHAAAFAAGGRARPDAATPDGDPVPGERTAAQLTAAADRAAERERRVDDGLAELDRWLADQITAGLARVAADPWSWVEPTAARMVDAQAPGVAAWLRRLPPVVTAGGEWPRLLLEELALLHLLARGWAGRSGLPADLLATVREHVGFPVPRADVLSGPAVRDAWTVVALRDLNSETVSTRRVWLHGPGTGRWAQVLFFSTGAAAPDASLVPGTVIDADLHFYPGRARLRAAVGAVHADPVPVTGWRPPVDTIAGAAAHWTRALAADPWQRQIALVLRGRVDPAGAGWTVTDPTGAAAPVHGDGLDLWRLFARTAGTVVDIAGEWSADGFRPAALARDGAVVGLGLAW